MTFRAYRPKSIEPRVSGMCKNRDPVGDHTGARTMRLKSGARKRGGTICSELPQWRFSSFAQSRQLPAIVRRCRGKSFYGPSKCLLAAPDCSHFWNACGRRHDGGRSSSQEIVQEPYKTHHLVVAQVLATAVTTPVILSRTSWKSISPLVFSIRFRNTPLVL